MSNWRRLLLTAFYDRARHWENDARSSNNCFKKERVWIFSKNITIFYLSGISLFKSSIQVAKLTIQYIDYLLHFTCFMKQWGDKFTGSLQRKKSGKVDEIRTSRIFGQICSLRFWVQFAKVILESHDCVLQVKIRGSYPVKQWGDKFTGSLQRKKSGKVDEIRTSRIFGQICSLRFWVQFAKMILESHDCVLQVKIRGSRKLKK